MFDVCRGARVMMFCISRRTHNTFPPYIRYVDVCGYMYIYIYMHHGFYEEFKIIYNLRLSLLAKTIQLGPNSPASFWKSLLEAVGSQKHANKLVFE